VFLHKSSSSACLSEYKVLLALCSVITWASRIIVTVFTLSIENLIVKKRRNGICPLAGQEQMEIGEPCPVRLDLEDGDIQLKDRAQYLL
jgi:hypothetical protein